jgi:flagellin FlaB
LDQALFTIFILILTVVIIGIWIYGMYDAYKTADKINKRKESFSRKSRLFWLPPAWLAFMILAAVVSYVLLGSGFFTTQKAQETVYEGVEQSTANIQMIGNVYGQSSNPSAGIDEIKFSIGLAPGAPAIDLTKMKIVFSTPSTNPIILTQGSTASNSVFTTKLNGDTPVSSLNLYQQVEIVFKTAPINANSKTNIELRPDVGDALPFSKTAPATIAATNVLY